MAKRSICILAGVSCIHYTSPLLLQRISKKKTDSLTPIKTGEEGLISTQQQLDTKLPSQTPNPPAIICTIYATTTDTTSLVHIYLHEAVRRRPLALTTELVTQCQEN